MISSCFATLRRKAPRTGSVTLFLSATIRATSPFSHPSSFKIVSSSPSAINLPKEQLGATSTQRTYASPFAPIPLTYSVSLSISLRVSVEAAFLATIPRTEPPFSIAEEKTEKPLFLTSSEISVISIPNRVSGLSEPYLFIASLYLRRGSGIGISTPSVSFIRR